MISNELPILALDSSTEACSVALLTDQGITQRFVIAPREQSEMLERMLNEVLDEANIAMEQVSMLALGQGPGSFSSLRIATAFTLAIAFVHNLPIVSVSSLAALALKAHQISGACQIACAMDARMGEVYWGCFHIHQQEVVPCGEEQVFPPEQAVCPVAETQVHWFGIGSGWKEYAQPLCAATGVTQFLEDALPDAACIAQLARSRPVVALAEIQPTYLRNQVALTLAEQQAARLAKKG